MLRGFDLVTDGVFAVDAGWHCVYANEPAARTFGRPREELVGRHIWTAWPPAGGREFYDACKRVAATGAPELLEGFFPLLGRSFECRLHPAAGGVLVVFSDVTERQAALTERAAAEQALRRRERQMRAIIDNIPSLIFIKDRDTNRYTMANEGFARLVGRAPEEIVGRRMEDLFAPEEVAARRIGDDQVYAAGRPLIEETTLVIGGQPRTYLLVRFLLPAEEGRPPALCGVSTDVTERRQVEAERDERVRWTSAIRGALAEGRMVVHAQPILDLRTDTVTDHELLVRMVAAGSGDVLAPGAFLPQAERYDVVQDIDIWMMEQAIGLARADRRVEVNLSSRSIGDAATTDALLALLESAGAAAARVGVEITETAAVEHLEAASSFAQRIAALGCRVALDDFGTGYGSFTYLRTLPVHALKIDLSFVRDMPASEHDQRVVRSIVAIARQFGLVTIAEGVESPQALELLRAMGVDHAQGWHVGRPAPLPD